MGVAAVQPAAAGLEQSTGCQAIPVPRQEARVFCHHFSFFSDYIKDAYPFFMDLLRKKRGRWA